MSADRISAEARGKLRVFKKQAQAHKLAIDRLLPALRAAACEISRRSSLRGRARVFDQLQACMARHARLEDARLEGRAPLALWSYLKPRVGVVVDPDDPGQTQDCITVEYVLAGAVKGPDSAGVGDGLWTLEASDHALLRLLTRSPGTDLSAVLFDAHRSILALSEDALRACIDDDILIVAGDGVFICECIHGPDVSIGYATTMHFRAKTWLHMDQLFPGQRPLPVATNGQRRLGDGVMRPVPLRDVQTRNSMLYVAVPEWADQFGIHGARVLQ